MNYFGRLRIKQLVNIIEKNIPKGTVLDVGVGAGDLSLALKKEGYKIKGIDNSYQAIKLCKKKGLDVQYGNAFNLKFRDNDFDLILSMDYQSILKRKKILKNLFLNI